MKISLTTTQYGTKLIMDIRHHRLGWMCIKLPDNPTAGIASVCDGRDDKHRFEHVVFLDYDNINENIVREELAWSVEKYKLTPFYLFFTKRKKDEQGYFGHYMAISLTKLPFNTILQILQETHCDYNYKRMPYYSRYKFWVLRFIKKKGSPAPIFLDMIPSHAVNMENRVSRAHLNFLEKWYPIPTLLYYNKDKSKELIMTPYLTVGGEPDDI